MKAHISVFDFSDYREFLRSHIKSLSKRRGVLKNWAEHLKVHSTLVSQVMIGQRNFTEEQCLELVSYLGLDEIAKEYFMDLLRQERAGTQKLKKYYQKRLENWRTRALNLSSRLPVDRSLTESESAIFYSSWIYSAVRLCTSIGEGKTIEEIAETLKSDRETILRVIEFLAASGFVIPNGSRYSIGTLRTHLAKDSPFLVRHHMNWRLKALQQSDRLSDEELMYTAPFSMKKKDYNLLRELLVGTIQEFLSISKQSEGEILACFNLDLFKI